MAKYIRPKQLEKQTVTCHFAMQWSTSARVDFYSLEKQTRACSYLVQANLLFDLYTILFHFGALLRNKILCKHPL